MFTVLKKDTLTRARLGLLETAHGTVETPSYVNVGTHASVRGLSMDECVRAGTQMIIVNTYHMWRTLGDEGVEKCRGLHAHMGWNRPLMTDSGGFQVFSLGAGREHGVNKVMQSQRAFAMREKNCVRVTEDGVFFYDDAYGKGEELYLDAERSIALQQQLGADIIVAFDEPTSPHHDYEYTLASLERTHAWEKRSLAAKTSNQGLYGVVQGGVFEDLRRASASYIGGLEFDGFAVGGAFGNSFGSSKQDTFQELEWVCPLLPEHKPRHLLGIGLVEDLFEAVSHGIDTFDCVVPTREGRHAGVWTREGRMSLRRGKFADDLGPIDRECGCEACEGGAYSRAAIHALVKAKDPMGGKLCSIHNVYFFNSLMANIRQSIADGVFSEFKARYLHGGHIS